jgi:phage terminase large subunit GpA-like protein
MMTTMNETRLIRPPTIDQLAANAKFETLEDIVAAAFAEMKPSNRMSVTDAALNYTRIGSGGGHSRPWSLEKTPYLETPQNVLTSLEFTGMVFVGPARTGKALPLDTDIPTPLGWRKMEDLTEGDYVFGADGLPTQISFATEPMFGHRCYEVRFADGTSIVADAEHLWNVRDTRKQYNGTANYTRILTTEEILLEGLTCAKSNRLKFAIPITSAVQYKEKDLLLDPYILGLWLGDGSKHNCTLSVGRDDLDATCTNIAKPGYYFKVYKPSNIRRCYTLPIMGPDHVYIDQYLSTMGVNDEAPKRIPNDYLTASEHQRRELLRGLMDTDGSIFGTNGRHVQFVTVERDLALQVKELVASLGYKASIRTKESFIGRKRYRDAHLIEFTVYDPTECFAMPRKIAKSKPDAPKRETQTGSRFIKEIVPVESVPVRCIKVEAEDSLFLAGRDYVVTHNTVMGLNWVSHTVKTDPADMLYVHMDRENARKWSNGDLNRFLMASTAIKTEQLTARQYDNTFDKTFKSGMRFLLTYPTASNLSGITVGRVGFIDYDRMDDDVDGEGNPFDLGSMRTTTFGRFAMTYAESSPNPNKEIQDPRWMPATPHQAPPIRGIFEIYNRGDRRMLYWKCLHCGCWFLPKFACLDWGGRSDPMEARENTVMVCPTSGCVIEPKHKDALNLGARWLRDGEALTSDDVLYVLPGQKVARSSIASFWLLGPQAAYQPWGQLVEKYLRALIALGETGDDGPLRKTVTTDQGMYYIPQGRLSDLSPEILKQQAEDWGSTPENPTVPEGVRFLIAAADVQKTAFVCQVHGFCENGDVIVVDTFKLRLSYRTNSNGDRLPIEPHAFSEDWQVLRELMDRSYELADGSARRMKVRATAADSGGHEGVTGHAYNFWRGLKKTGDHRRFILVKGGSTPTAPLARTIWPDSAQKEKLAVAKGDVPVVLFQSNTLKDRVQLLLNRRVRPSEGDEPSVGGMLRYPDWVEDWFFKQFTAEIRTEKGWENTRKKRNEVFDLAYYAIGVAFRPIEKDVPFLHFGADRLRWNETNWAMHWDFNELVFSTREDAPQKPASPKSRSLADLGSKLA